MQRSRWPLELSENALGKHPMDSHGLINTHATNASGTPPAINPNANTMQRNATPRHAMPDKLCNLLLVVN